MAENTIKILAAAFSSSVVAFDNGPGGLTRVTVKHPAATAEIYLQGAHVTSFVPAGEKPVLFLSAQSKFVTGTAIRGGVPICFPWFGPKPGKPAHGFARTTEWELFHVAALPDKVVLRFRLSSNDATRALWPVDFSAEYMVRVGTTLGLELKVTNTSSETLEYEEALHSYLYVSDAAAVTVEGVQGATYLDKPGVRTRLVDAADRVGFAGEVDRVYVGTTNPCTIYDPGVSREVLVSKTGSNCTIIWNPGAVLASKMADLGAAEAKKFVCVETANCADFAILLAAGEAHITTTTIGVKQK